MRFKLAMAALLSSAVLPISAQDRLPLTLTDSVQMSVFVDVDGNPMRGPGAIQWHGDRGFCVEQRGVVESGVTISTLHLLSRSGHGAAMAIQRVVVAEVASGGNDPPITATRWMEEGRAIYFLAREPNGNRRLYRSALDGAAAQPMTTDDLDVAAYAARGPGVVYAVRRRIERDVAAPASSDVTGRSLLWLLEPDDIDRLFGADQLELRSLNARRDAPVVDVATGRPLTLTSAGLFVPSPDGRWLAVLAPVGNVPEAWKSVPAGTLPGWYRLQSGEWPGIVKVGRDWPMQVAVADMHSGTLRYRLAAPTGQSLGYQEDFSGVEWSTDSRDLTVGNTFVPDSDRNTGLTERPCLARWSFGAARVRCLKRGASARGVGIRPPPDFFVAEDLNSPPRVVRSSARDVVMVFDPNLELRSKALGIARAYFWSDRQGRPWEGGLLMPENRRSPARCPLVIQTHGFDPAAFLNDGIYSTASAARLLAAQGIAVLQVQERKDNRGTPAEALDAQDGYTSAVEALVRDGLVDPAKVGISGFSVTGWYVLETLRRNPGTFRAAVLADPTIGSYGELLLNVDYGSPRRLNYMIASFQGAFPQGEDLKRWREEAMEYRSGEIATPVRFEATAPSSLVYTWNVYAAMRLQGRDVSLFYHPRGTHVLFKPRERFASQQGVIDWFERRLK